jgi:hypothetical protein
VSPEQRRYLVGQSGVGAAVGNALLNGLAGWLITRGLAEFPVWQFPGVVADIAGTAFGVTFGTALGATFQVPRDMKKGKISLGAVPPSFTSALSRLPAGALRRALWLGVISIAVFTPPVVAVLLALGDHALRRNGFIALKAGFSAIEAAIVTPLVVLGVLWDLARAKPAQ